jgi:hypothetical protein
MQVLMNIDDETMNFILWEYAKWQKQEQDATQKKTLPSEESLSSKQENVSSPTPDTWSQTTKWRNFIGI